MLNWLELTAILNRPIAFHRIFADVGGGAIPGLFLSQAFYWTSRTKDPNGWFYKTQEEWQQETSLIRSEQDRARRELKARNLLEEERRGLPCKLYYRVNKTVLLESISSLVEGKERNSQFGKSSKQEWSDDQTGLVNPANLTGKSSKQSIFRDYSENTSNKPPTPQGSQEAVRVPEKLIENEETSNNSSTSLTEKPEAIPQTRNTSEIKNSAPCDNSVFVGHGNISPDGKSRPFNQVTGKWHSIPFDPWMKNCNPDRAFKQWVCDQANAKGRKCSLADASGEIRNNFQRAGDLWEEYQEEQARSREVEQMKEPVPEQEVQAPVRKNNQFAFYRSIIQGDLPMLRQQIERGIEWAQQQPNVKLIYDDNGKVIDLEEIKNAGT